MNKELCFYIENESLYLEQVLVDYMDIPIFFLCKSDKRFYIALCTDIEESEYIVAELSFSDVYKLLHGKIPMRNVFLTRNGYWEIISGEEISSDSVVKRTADCIDSSVLPEEDACFEILTEEIRLYVEKFDNEFLSQKYFRASDERLDLDNQLLAVDNQCIDFENRLQQINTRLQGVDNQLRDNLHNKYRVGSFTDFWGYSFQTRVEPLDVKRSDWKGQYVKPSVKMVAIIQFSKSEKWYSDDVASVAV